MKHFDSGPRLRNPLFPYWETVNVSMCGLLLSGRCGSFGNEDGNTRMLSDLLKIGMLR